MATITITFETGNAAFTDDLDGTIAAVLGDAGHCAVSLLSDPGFRDCSELAVRDPNGNTVGHVTRD